MNNGNKLIVIGKLSKKDEEHPDHLRNHYYCEFQTGYKGIICETTIVNGTAYDPLYPSIYGVAYIGEGVHTRYMEGTKDFSPEYKLWYGMLKRVYDEGSLKKYPSYKNVTVNPRWLNYQNFCDDLKTLENYSLWKEFGGSFYHLDKDLFSQKLGRKEYGKDTCLFLSVHDNTSLGALTGKTYYQYNVEEKTYETFTNLSKFSEEKGINSDVLTRAVKKNKEVNGYFYGYLEENTQDILPFIEQKYKEFKENIKIVEYNWGLYHRKTQEIKKFTSLVALSHSNSRFAMYNIRDCAYRKTIYCYNYYHIFKLPENYDEMDLVEYAKNDIKEVRELKASVKDKPFIATNQYGVDKVIKNIKEFSDRVNIPVADIQYCLYGARKSYRSWKFRLLGS